MPVDNQERDIVLVPEFIHLLGYLRHGWIILADNPERHCTGCTIHPMVNILGREAANTSKMHENVLPLKPNARDVRQFRQEKASDRMRLVNEVERGGHFPPLQENIVRDASARCQKVDGGWTVEAGQPIQSNPIQ